MTHINFLESRIPTYWPIPGNKSYGDLMILRRLCAIPESEDTSDFGPKFRKRLPRIFETLLPCKRTTREVSGRPQQAIHCSGRCIWKDNLSCSTKF